MTIDLPPERPAYTASEGLTTKQYLGGTFWSNGNNWTPSLPVTGDRAEVYVGGSSIYDLGTLTLDSVRISHPNGHSLSQISGVFTSNEYAVGVTLPGQPAGRAEVRFGGTNTRLTAGATYIGANGIGSLNVDSGTFIAQQFLSIGDAPGAHGRVFHNNGEVRAPEIDVGYFGTGTYEIHGGTVLIGGLGFIGANLGSAGTFEMHGGRIVAPIWIVGLDGDGTMSMSAGTLHVTQFLDVGEGSMSSGHLTQDGGSIWTPEFAAGFNGKGVYEQSGGTLTTGPFYVGPIGKATISGGVVSTTILDIDQGGLLDLVRHEIGVADTHNLADLILAGKVFGDGAVGYSTDTVRMTVAGDVTLDRTVGIADQAVIGANWNLPGKWYDGDVNHDGIVNIGDYSIMAANWGQTYSRTNAVPEPLAAAGLLGLLMRRRGR